MSTKRFFLALVTVAALGATAAYVRAQIDGPVPDPATASVPELIPYRGHLEQNGQAVTGNVDFTFYLVDAPTKGIADALWQEQQSIAVVGGEFSAILGATHAFNAAGGERLFERHELYLGLQVGGADLQNKQRLVAAPYAITARQAQQMNVDGNLTVVGSAVITGGASIAGDATVSGGLRVGPGRGDVPSGTLIASNARVTGAVSAASATLTDGVTAANATLSGTLTAGTANITNGTISGTVSLGSQGHLSGIRYTRHTTPSEGDGIALVSTSHRFCFLTDVTGVGSGTPFCAVYPQGSLWRMTRRSANCTAACLEF